MKLVVFIFFLLLTAHGFSQSADPLMIGQHDSVYSSILKQKRNLFIHLPPGYHRGSAVYPVVYLLDGESLFQPVSAAVKQLSSGSVIPDMIVVAIENINRNLDFTPTKDTSTGFQPNGGGELFADFLEKELIPYINQKYRTAPYKMIVGHSLGGLFAAHILLNRSFLFNAYILIDPALWWDQQVVNKRSSKMLRSGQFEGQKTYLAMSNTLPARIKDTAMALKDTASGTLGVRSILRFRDLLLGSKPNLIWSFDYYKDESHMVVPLISTYNGLKFIFDFYKRPSQAEITDSSMAILENHYKMVSAKMGFTILPSESDIGGMIYVTAILDKKYPRALAMLEAYERLYPDSPTPYEWLSQFHEGMGNQQKAKEYREKAELKKK